jgi:diadenosine tetraphosphate (Ap4A) HIT family hydrolase
MRDVPCGSITNSVARSKFASLYFNRYPLRWGHALVIAHTHVIAWSDLSRQANDDAQQLIYDFAQCLERVLGAKRVYVAALGTTQVGLPMTSPHLHWHIVPLFEQGERPADVFTWEHGVYQATDDEWTKLSELLSE